jgi:hypothetical protein
MLCWTLQSLNYNVNSLLHVMNDMSQTDSEVTILNYKSFDLKRVRATELEDIRCMIETPTLTLPRHRFNPTFLSPQDAICGGG